jgi:hypothetical protein
MSTHEILIPLAAVLVTVTLNAIINTKIKFAQNAPQAITDIRKTLMLVAFWIAQLFIAWLLISQLASDAPLTRHSLALILILSFGLFHSYIMYWFREVMTIMKDMVSVLERHSVITGKIVDVIEPAPPNKSLHRDSRSPSHEQ